MYMSNEITLNEISNQLMQANNNLNSIQNISLWFIGLLVSAIVCYILYKVLDEFVGF